MYRLAARIITAIVVAATGIYFGLKLAVYADADDAPGGVVIGVLFMFVSLGFGLWIALREARKPLQNGN